MILRISELEGEKLDQQPTECPVCGKKETRTKISRHIMNSKKNTEHKKFIDEQEEYIKHLYRTLLPEELDPYSISYSDGIFCSPTYIRRIFKTFNDYKEKCGKKRSVSIAKQHKEGKRTLSPNFVGWSPSSREELGKRGLSQERYDKVIELFNSDLSIKDISAQTGCKHETIRKVWDEAYDKEIIEERIETYHIKSISANIDIELFKKLVLEGKNRKELASQFSVCRETISNLMKKLFSEEEIDIWREKARKAALIRSLQITGMKGITGSRAENYCYELLKEELDCEVIHHDVDTLPPFEIDITIPEKKVAVCWDGPFHRRAIFGPKRLKKVQDRDKRKHDGLIKNGWAIMVVEDNNQQFNPTFVQQKVGKIIKKINKKGKVIV